MKIIVNIKDPDAFSEAIDETVLKSLKDSGLDPDEKAAIRKIREEKASDFLCQWVDCGEYVTLEFDTETGTARILDKQ
jgi:hypothetical protein